MRAVLVEGFGDSSNLRTAEVPDPEPAEGEARVVLRAAGLNSQDVTMREGRSRYKLPLPFIQGREGAGVVEKLGSGTHGVSVGDRVVVLPLHPCGTCEWCRDGLDNRCTRAGMPGVTRPGTYAGKICVPSASLAPMPDAMSFEIAAGTPVAFGTAYQMLVILATVRAGENVIVTGASGGLGSACVQLAKHLGARVFACASSPEKLAFARAQGADVLVDYAAGPFAETVLEQTGGRGADVAIENVGGAIFEETLKAMAPRGRVVNAGAHGGRIASLDLLDFYGRELVLMGSYRQTRTAHDGALALVAGGTLRPELTILEGLDAVRGGLDAIGARTITGKLVVRP